MNDDASISESSYQSSSTYMSQTALFHNGPLLKMKSSLLGTKWKPKWVYLDHKKFIQWHTDKKPSASDLPHHGYHINRCRFEINNKRQFSFTIISTEYNVKLTFAASSQKEYDSCIGILNRFASGGTDNDKNEVDEEIMALQNGGERGFVEEDDDEEDNDNASQSTYSESQSQASQSQTQQNKKSQPWDSSSEMDYRTPKKNAAQKAVPKYRPKSESDYSVNGYEEDSEYLDQIGDAKLDLAYLEGPLWKMKTNSIIGNSSWQKKWIYVDHEKLLQWHTDFKPDKLTPPRQGFPLGVCTVEESDARQYAFKIKNTHDGSWAIFAARGVDEYRSWMGLLLQFCGKKILEENLRMDGHNVEPDFEESKLNLDGNPVIVDNEDSSTVISAKDIDSEDEEELDKLARENVDKRMKSPFYKGYIRSGSKGSNQPSNVNIKSPKSSETVFVEGVLLKLKNNLLTGSEVWRPKWAYADAEKLLQWHSKEKPPKSTLPNVGFPLSYCRVEKCSFKSQRYAFRITDTTTDFSIVFAVPSSYDFDNWLSVLSQGNRNNESVQDEGKGQEESSVATEIKLKSLEDDMIRETFIAQNMTSDPRNPHICFQQFVALLNAISDCEDYQFFDPNAAESIFKDLGLQPGYSLISYSDFIRWWKWYKSLSKGSNVSKHRDIINRWTASVDKSIHLFGTSVSHEKLPNKTIAKLFRIDAPVLDNVFIADHFEVKDDDDWCSLYNSSLDKLLAGTTSRLHTEDDQERSSSEVTLDHFLEYQAIYGAFLASAVSGTRLIVDEYVLPPHLRTVLTVHGNDEYGKVEVFGHDGLLFVVVEAYSTVAKVALKNKNGIMRDPIFGIDEMQRKTAAIEMRSLDMVDQAIFECCEDQKNFVNPKFRACTLLSTIVDFGGFRVKVYCPFTVKENQTLIYGYNSENSAFMCTAPPLMNFMTNLATKYLNLQANQVSVKTMSPFKSRNSQGMEYQLKWAPVNIVSRALACHESFDDGRVYIMSTESLLPCEIPRWLSHDPDTRRFRPEFVKTFSSKFAADTFRYPDSIGLDDCNNVADIADAASTVAASDYASTSASKAGKDSKSVLTGVLKGSRKLYGKTIPFVAAKLDNLQYLPLDSYSMTEFLHQEGVNCRHMGLLYQLCKTRVAKQALLAEIIGRSFKTLFNQTMRYFTRQCQKSVLTRVNETITSRSDHNDEYVDIANSWLRECRGVTTDLFNLTLGSGQEMQEFWKENLLEVIFNKFGIVLTLEEAVRDTRAMVLFLSMQYHTGCVFEDKEYPNFFSNSTAKPLEVSDIKVVNAANTKAKVKFPGIFNEVNQAADAFLVHNLFESAILAYRLRLSAIGTVFGGFDSLKAKATIAWNIYYLSLALYKGGHYEDARNLLIRHLSNNSKYNASSARMMSLLVAIEFEDNKVDQAMIYYDTAVATNSVVFGKDHPIHAVMCMMLADLYRFKRCSDHCKTMTIIAYESMRRVCGDLHCVSARYAMKLGLILLLEREYQTCADIFSSVLLVFDSYNQRGMHFDRDTTLCLHALTVSLSASGDYKHALPSAIRCVSGYVGVKFSISRINFLHSLMILCDLFTKNNDVDAAVDVGNDIWTEAGKKPYSLHHLADLILTVSGRLLYKLYDSMSLSGKGLLQSVSQETKRAIKSGELSQSLYSASISLVIKALWTGKVRAYFESIMLFLQKHEADGLRGGQRPSNRTGFDQVDVARVQASIVFAVIKSVERDLVKAGF